MLTDTLGIMSMKISIFALLFFLAIPTLRADIIKLCGDPNYPPFNWAENGHIIGVGPEVVSIIFNELGHEVDDTYTGNWARCQRDLEYGYRDIFTAGYKTSQREKFMRYVKIPLKDDPQVVIVKKGKEFAFNKWEDLIGKVAGHIFGSTLGSEFDKFLEKNIVVQRVSSRIQNFKKLETEKIDFEVVGLWTTLIQMKNLGFENKLSYLKTPVSTENMYIAISKKSKFINDIAYIEQRLKQMHKDGSIDKLIKKYINLLTPTDITTPY